MSGKNKGGVPGRDAFQRMNFLYQASTLMAGKYDVLSCYYGNLMKQIGKKSVLRIHPSIKRTLCKRCSLMLKPGITMDIEIKEKTNNLCLIKCRNCEYIKNFRINPKYKLWTENPEAIVETYHLNENKSASKQEHKNNVKPKNEELADATNNSKQQVTEEKIQTKIEITQDMGDMEMKQ